MCSIQQPSAILLMGPTASGKSSLALEMAFKLNAEIISVDSALVYKGLDIGTAKPSLTDRAAVVHHLIDIIDPSLAFSTGQFRSAALALIKDIHLRGKQPLLVGGTMLYFNALINGMAVLPEASAEIRQKLEQELHELGKEELYRRLAAIDPVAAARIHINDPQRIQRALEVYEISGKPISSFFEQQTTHTLPFAVHKLIIAPAERHTLHEKIACRFQTMLDQGLLDEVAALQKRGDLDFSYPAIRCVGYRQVWEYLEGQFDYAEMRDKAIAATRQLAKRQFTWLRKQENACHLISGSAGLLDKALHHCQAFNNG